MSLKNLPRLATPSLPSGYRGEPPSRALAAWAERPLAADADDATITIYEQIGEDPWSGDGVSSKRIGAALRSIGQRDVTVKINSPGGYADEGVAIYNLLREHPAKVSVKIMGIAASAASVIAMAGDDVTMGLGTLLMVHNGWGLVIGNRHDFREAADIFEKFDRSMADIYAARTGGTADAMLTIMDGEARVADGTWMTPEEAIALGFVDATFDAPEISADAGQSLPAHISARRRLEAALAQQRLSRDERTSLLEDLFAGARDAAGSGQQRPRDATLPDGLEAIDVMAAIKTLKGD